MWGHRWKIWCITSISFAVNDKLPNRYVLIRKIDREKGVVIEFRWLPYKERVDRLLKQYCFNVHNMETFVSALRHFITTVNAWLDLTNGEFILDTYHNFEIRKWWWQASLIQYFVKKEINTKWLDKRYSFLIRILFLIVHQCFINR